MDARLLLRQYLEQRRELGESEFVLDAMSVDEAMQVLGGLRRGSAPMRDTGRNTVRSAAPTPRAPTADTVAPPPVAQPVHAVVPSVVPDTPHPSVPPQPAPMAAATNGQGLQVGSANENLFTTNPFANLHTLDDIAHTVAKCTRCALYKTATNPVPGEGNPDADLVCVGEAPGANEDATGRPFVGRAGELLTKILAAIEITREEVFICNVLKHRPPGNRNPAPNEVQACSPYLIRQIEIVRPKVIVAFGTFAAQTLLQTKLPIGKLRGMVHRYYGVPFIVTYHPAALLRNPAWKRPTWEDVKLARRVLDGTA